MSRFRSVDFDTIAPLLPFDGTAARVASKGERFDWQASDHHRHSDIAFPMRALTPSMRANPEFTDFTGMKAGRLTVLGLCVETGNGKKARWQVRCACGAHEVRSARYLRACAAGAQKGAGEPACDWCGKTRRLQAGHGAKDWRELMHRKADGEGA